MAHSGVKGAGLSVSDGQEAPPEPSCPCCHHHSPASLAFTACRSLHDDQRPSLTRSQCLTTLSPAHNTSSAHNTKHTAQHKLLRRTLAADAQKKPSKSA
jgi:hypothetical protein